MKFNVYNVYKDRHFMKLIEWENWLNVKCLLSSGINKKEMETWKVDQWKRKGNMESTVWNFTVESIVHCILQKYGNWIWVCWCQNKLFYVIYYVQYLSWFMRFCAFKIYYCKKQGMYCFLPFGFINVIIFIIHPSCFYSTFVGED